jgi:hypothetical protein
VLEKRDKVNGVDGINLVLERIQGEALVDTVMNIAIP